MLEKFSEKDNIFFLFRISEKKKQETRQATVKSQGLSPQAPSHTQWDVFKQKQMHPILFCSNLLCQTIYQRLEFYIAQFLNTQQASRYRAFQNALRDPSQKWTPLWIGSQN